MAGGEKAQIRLANPNTYFNITKYARFENIEFTGEDLFAVATNRTGSLQGFMGNQGILAFMPFTKCSIKDDPSTLDTLSEFELKQEDFMKVVNSGANNFVYEC